jgi:RNA polymerase sigma-70 factor (ECF subfamily)
MRRYADLTSTELVRVCARSQDEKAWVEFIRRFQVVIAAAVLRTARRWEEPSRALLDDLVQDTYLKLCENDCRLLASFRPQSDGSFYGFLKVVAANVVHDHCRSERAAKRGSGQTDQIVEQRLEPIQKGASTASTYTFDVVTQHLQLDQIDRILNQLTAGKDQERKRTIFWLRHQQGLTASEIASISSIRLTTEGVESVLMRLAIMIRGHVSSSNPHREVKVMKRKNRSNRVGS